MSASKSVSSTRRRLSLLSGGSLAAALVLSAGALAPTAALAANECGDPNTNTTGSDTFTCAGSYAAITYPLTNGTLTLNLQNNLTTTTGGLVVTASGSNTVNISRIADAPANSGDPSLTSTSTVTAALEVTRTTGGSISVNLTDNDSTDTPMAISGVSAGVRLQNAGSSSTSFTTANGTITATGGAGIELTAGTGSITLSNNATVTGSTSAVRVTAGANVTMTNGIVGEINGMLAFANTGNTTITNDGRWNAGGATALRNTATSTGSATLTNSVGGVLATNLDGAATSIDFGIGGATFANVGRLAVGHGTDAAATLTLTGVAAWNNSGTVYFGADADLLDSDGATNDRVVVTRTGGGTFTGSAASRFVMDVDFGASQADCAAAVTADCLDLRGQSTAGTTTVEINTVGLGLGAERIVLVDAAGAGTNAGTFTLSASSTGYRDIDGGLIDGGLFLYRLTKDTTAKQHALVVAAIDGEAFELGMVARQVSEPWRVATGMWRDRQAQLRGDLADRTDGYAPGVWLKIAGGFVDEDRVDTLTVGTGSLEFSTAYAQETTAIVGGVDLLRFIGQDRALVFGVTAGTITSSADFISATSMIDMEGTTFGAYGSALIGGAYVDAIVSTTDLDLTHTGFGASYESAAKSFGYQLEGGWRMFQTNDDGAWVEPLIALTYVSTQVDDLVMGPVTTRFADAASLRGAVGMRVGGELEMEALSVGFSATGRLWKEFDGDGASTLTTAFGSAALTDDRIDGLGDVGVALAVSSPSGRLSANLGYSYVFKDDYQNTGANFGLRYRW